MKIERKIYATILGCLFISIALGSAYAVTRTITPTSDTIDTYIRNSNGKYWAYTAANLQLAIWDLNSTGGTVNIPPGTITVTTTIDCTQSYLTLFLDKGTNISASTNGKPVFDFTGAAYCRIEGGYIYGNPTNHPSVGFLFSRDPGGDTAGSHRLIDVQMYGYFSYACIYDMGSELNVFDQVFVWNLEPGGDGIKIVYNNLNSITSPWSTPTGGFSTTEINIINSHITYTGGTDNASSIYIGYGNVRDIYIHDCFLYSDGLAKIEFNSTDELDGIYSINNIRTEGTSTYSICSNLTTGAIYNLFVKNYVEGGTTTNYFLQFNDSMYYCSFEKPIWSYTNHSMYIHGSLVRSRIEGGTEGIQTIKTVLTGGFLYSYIMLPGLEGLKNSTGGRPGTTVILENSSELVDTLMFDRRTTIPSPAVEGMIYYNLTTHMAYIYNGTIWDSLT